MGGRKERLTESDLMVNSHALKNLPENRQVIYVFLKNLLFSVQILYQIDIENILRKEN